MGTDGAGGEMEEGTLNPDDVVTGRLPYGTVDSLGIWVLITPEVSGIGIEDVG